MEMKGRLFLKLWLVFGGVSRDQTTDDQPSYLVHSLDDKTELKINEINKGIKFYIDFSEIKHNRYS